MKKFYAALICLALTSSTSVAYGAAAGRVTTRPATAVDTTAKEDLFRVSGTSDDFILLDHDEDGFFVTSKKFFGTHAYDPDNDGKFDIEKENNIAYWLNNEFLENGATTGDTTYVLPNQIKEHLVEHDWLCEAGYATTDYNEDYVVTAKLALMSITEWRKYNSVVGLLDDNISYYYWLRSVAGQESGSIALVISTGGGITTHGKMPNAYGVRPVFYLDNDFFLEEKIDMAATGSNVLKKIREVYTKEELSKVYSSSDIQKIYRSLPPQVKNVKMSGLPQVGHVLKTEYTYFSPEMKPEKGTDIRWLRSKTKNGTYSLIYGANGAEYEIRPEDAGYYIRSEVVPKTENQIGNSIKSTPTNTAVKAAHAPYAENVYVDGKLFVGKRLIARYNYADDDDDREEGTIIKWQISDDGENFEDIPNENGVNYIIDEECAGKFLRITVEVRNNSHDGIGAEVISETTERVRVYPEAEKPVILKSGNEIILSSALGSEDIICWETETDDNGFVVAKVGGSYSINGTEKTVRAAVIPVSDGVMGKIIRSEVIELDGKNVDQQNGIKEISVSGEQKVIVKASASDMAYSISVELNLGGVEIKEVYSEGYEIMKNITDGKAEFVLTRKNIGGAVLDGKVLEIEVNGSGKLEIEEAKGVYKAENENYVFSDLNLSLEK